MYQKTYTNNHQKGAKKVARNPVKIAPTQEVLRKPKWIRVKANSNINKVRKLLRTYQLNTVCEDASCPNLSECFAQGTATFMILGDMCTRRCPFCDVAHGKPNLPDPSEPSKIALAVKEMQLKYVVITSVNRDDLKDSGAGHFVACIKEINQINSKVKVEILVPDFRGKQETALKALSKTTPAVFNHNIETVPRLYAKCRPGADYQVSLNLLKKFKQLNPNVLTKSGLMLGLGESNDEIKQVLQDLPQVDILTLGQYLQPSKHHLPVERYVSPDEFNNLKQYALDLGFSKVAAAPMVRSSYHADLLARGENH